MYISHIIIIIVIGAALLEMFSCEEFAMLFVLTLGVGLRLW